MALEQSTSIMISMAKPVIDEEEITEVEAVLRSGIISHGEKVEEFEKAFAAFIGTEYAVAVNSGTAALYIALLTHGIGPGDEVITVPFTFIATSNSVLSTGAIPVFADIEEDTFNVNPYDILNRITTKTKAIIPVHLYGQSCDMGTLTEIAEEYGLAIIEDACQAHGAEYHGKRVGGFGTGCFSFYPTKNMTTGEGGIITTNDEEIAEKARLIRNHGQRQRYHHEILGYNYRMTNISGAIGLCQLKKLTELNSKRIRNAEFLTEKLSDVEGLITPVVRPYTGHVFHQYTVRVAERFGLSRDELREKLRNKGISTEVYYPVPIHKQPLYRDLGYDDHLPVSEKAALQVLSLPVHPSITGEDLRYIVESIINCRR